jgi:hypothetical protein
LYLANPAQGQYFGGSNSYAGSRPAYAMLLSAHHRVASHFSVLANYTLSHCISGPFSSELDGADSQSGEPNADGATAPDRPPSSDQYSVLRRAPSDKILRAIVSTGSSQNHPYSIGKFD